MQETRQNATKTIHLTYPAPYSQSSVKVEGRPPTPKATKRKRPVNSQSALSWLIPEKKVVKRPMRPVSSLQPIGNPNICPRRASTQFGPRPSRQLMVRRPDPSAPHLKYGLFRAPRKPWIGGIKKMGLETTSSYIVPRPDPTVPHLKYGMFRPPSRPFPSFIRGRGVSNAAISRPAFKKEPSTDHFMKRKKPARIEVLNEQEQHPPPAPPEPRSAPHRDPPTLSTSKVHHLDIKPGRSHIPSTLLPRVSFIQ